MKKTLCLLLVLLMAAACTGCCAPIVSEPSQESTVTVNGQSAESFLRNNFPRIDGSTSTIPLDAAVRSAIFSLPISTATAQVTHNN